MAVELFNRPKKSEAFKELADRPYLMRMLSMMARAQRGEPLHGATRKEASEEAMQVAELHRNSEDDD